MKRTEHILQCGCLEWFRYQYPKLSGCLFSIPNGAKLAGATAKDRAIRGAILKREGLRPGVADLFLMAPSGDFAGLWIEMKTPRGNQSPEQKAFEADALAAGYGYAMPRSFDEFREVVTRYLEKGEY